MYPWQHLIAGVILASFLFLVAPQIGFISVAIIILASVLIDVDHYVYHFYKEKNFNLKKAYTYFVDYGKKIKKLPRQERNKTFIGIFLLHGFEIMFLLLLATIFVSKYFLFVLLAFNLHLLLDMIETKRYLDRPIKLFLIKDIIDSRKLERLEN